MLSCFCVITDRIIRFDFLSEYQVTSTNTYFQEYFCGFQKNSVIYVEFLFLIYDHIFAEKCIHTVA